jgi:hypothetical protein
VRIVVGARVVHARAVRRRIIAVALVIASLAVFVCWRLLDAEPEPSPPIAPVSAAAPLDTAPVRVDDAASDATPETPPPTSPIASATAAPTKPPTAEGKGRVVVVVVDKRGRPISSYDLFAFPLLPNPKADASTRARSMPDPSDLVRINVDDAAGTVEIDLRATRARIGVSAKRHRDNEAELDVKSATTQSVRIVLDDSPALAGVVRDAATRAPIRRARVTLEGGADVAETDDAGRFELSSLPDGRFSLDVEAGGYQSLNLGGFRGDRDRDVSITIDLDEVSDGGPAGEFIGTGFQMGSRNEDGHGPYVARLMPGTPAAAVLHVGDDIVDVDSDSVDDQQDARMRMLGDLGSSVRVGVMRDGVRLQFDIERARIADPTRKPRPLRHPPPAPDDDAP